MKIYTKKGDEGKTSLIGGTRVSKSSIRIDAYGTVDELNSYIGWVRDLCERDEHANVLLEIQDRLFTIGSLLAADPVKSKMELPSLNESDVVYIEKQIDKMNEELPEMKSFILPGGHPAVSCCHVARCVCRRAERATVLLSENDIVDSIIIKYLNRLSDYLFVLARSLAKDLNALETPWKARV
jgi:cob(I)alamin adenosyltransferase